MRYKWMTSQQNFKKILEHFCCDVINLTFASVIQYRQTYPLNLRARSIQCLRNIEKSKSVRVSPYRFVKDWKWPPFSWEHLKCWRGKFFISSPHHFAMFLFSSLLGCETIKNANVPYFPNPSAWAKIFIVALGIKSIIKYKYFISYILFRHSPFRQQKTKDKHEIDKMTLTMVREKLFFISYF